MCTCMAGTSWAFNPSAAHATQTNLPIVIQMKPMWMDTTPSLHYPPPINNLFSKTYLHICRKCGYSMRLSTLKPDIWVCWLWNKQREMNSERGFGKSSAFLPSKLFWKLIITQLMYTRQPIHHSVRTLFKLILAQMMHRAEKHTVYLGYKLHTVPVLWLHKTIRASSTG